jgi:hypothetical protein
LVSRVWTGLVVVSLISAVGCSRAREPSEQGTPIDDPRRDFRPTPWEPFSVSVDVAPKHVVFDALCADMPSRCRKECREYSDLAFATCALSLRYGGDRTTLALARRLLESHGAVAGVETRRVLDAGYVGAQTIAPASPTGAYRRHLVSVVEGLGDVEDTFAALAKQAPQPMMFRTRPHALRFFRTLSKQFPSAWAKDGVVGYNVEGPLHGEDGDIGAVLFHELFHLNDQGHDRWSERVLDDLYTDILARCDNREDCLEPFAPDDVRVEGGTFYALDEKTNDVREYAADLALRWLREQRAILRGESLPDGPFRCKTPENAKAWKLVVDEFFGGVDLTPPCSQDPSGGAREEAAHRSPPLPRMRPPT